MFNKIKKTIPQCMVVVTFNNISATTFIASVGPNSLDGLSHCRNSSTKSNRKIVDTLAKWTLVTILDGSLTWLGTGN